MITSSGHFKIVEGVFYYPKNISDNWILQDPIRDLLNRYCPNISFHKQLLIVFANGIPKFALQNLLDKNTYKKILLINCGENVYVKDKFISYVYNGLNRLGLPRKVNDALTLNYFISRLLALETPIQKNSFFRHLTETDSRYNYWLTNDLVNGRDNLFFTPYFYVFCRQLIPLLSAPTQSPPAAGKKFCAFIVSNAANIDRVTFFKKLSRYKRIDSFGKVLNNAKLATTPGEHYLNVLRSNHLLYKKYKFVISFENSYAQGYVTEKLVNALAGGSIPIYRGADDVGKYFNLNRIIDYNHYGRCYDKMIDKIVELDKDDDKYHQFVGQPCFPDDRLPPGYEEFDQRLITFLEKKLNITCAVLKK